MRKFSSYGPPNTTLHYYAPRESLIERAYDYLIGEQPEAGGHYVTVWAPRQTGKTWVMQQVVNKIRASGDFEVAILTMQSAKTAETVADVLDVLVTKLSNWFQRPFPNIATWQEFSTLFTKAYFNKPVILILDEFDAFNEEFIRNFANEFRSIYIDRLNEATRKSGEKSYLLHGLALIGVRSVLGVENVTGSPFNIQRSLHIPNLTAEEVTGMFHWYEQESGQHIEPDIIDRIFYEFQGQPGLTGWFGELLTETYNDHNPTLTMADFDSAYAAALTALPNNNILNIVSKAKQEPYKRLVLEMFQTGQKIEFTYDDPLINFLYLNGVVDQEIVDKGTRYLKFPSPFIQKRLFNTFARELFRYIGSPYRPFEDLSDTITPAGLNLKNLLGRYERHLQQNREWLLQDAPRRRDLRVYEAVYHFSLYRYLQDFLDDYGGQVYPEFPTGNGQIDLLITYEGQRYGLEVKSYTTEPGYRQALRQAARYGQQLGLADITLSLFVEAVDEANRQKYEVLYTDAATGVTVRPVFVATGR